MGGGFWSPDRRSIAFFADGKLKRIDAAGGPPQVLCSVSANAHRGSGSSYVSDETGRKEIYARPFPGPAEARRTSTSGGTLPRWRRDGKDLFYVEGERLMAVPTTFDPGLATGAPTALFDRRPARIIDFDVARDGGSFLINSEVTWPGNTPFNLIVNWTSTLKKP